MKSHESAITLVGAGRDEPGVEHNSCQTRRMSPITIIGGITTAPVLAAASRKRSIAGRTGGRKGTISAVAPGTGTVAAIDAVLAFLAAITPPS